jgi:hypothetical protein
VRELSVAHRFGSSQESQHDEHAVIRLKTFVKLKSKSKETTFFYQTRQIGLKVVSSDKIDDNVDSFLICFAHHSVRNISVAARNNLQKKDEIDAKEGEIEAKRG